MTWLKATQLVDLTALDYSRLDGADDYLIELVTPFVIESESIYFSALTFTTLGYGDFKPTNTIGQVLAVSETALGVILLTILVFVFGRRATR